MHTLTSVRRSCQRIINARYSVIYSSLANCLFSSHTLSNWEATRDLLSIHLHVYISGVGRWFHLLGLQEPFPSPAKNGLDTRVSWAGRQCIFSVRAYVHVYTYTSCNLDARLFIHVHTIDYVWPTARKIETNFMCRECFYITLACQEFYGGTSPRSPCVPVFPTPLFHIALVACQDFYRGASPRSPHGSYATVYE